MAFDPSQPFEVEGGEQPSGFDPSKPFDVEEVKPSLDDRLETLSRTADGSPDANARFKQLADKAGIPYQAAKEIPEDVERDNIASEWRGFAKVAPSSSKYFDANPDSFELASDDHPALSAIEQGLVGLGKAVIPAPVQAAAKAASAVAGDAILESGKAVADSFGTWDNRLVKAGLGLVMGGEAAAARWARPDNVNAEYILQYRDQAQKVLDLINEEPDGQFRRQLMKQWGVVPQESGAVEREAALRNIGLSMAQREYDQSQSEADRTKRAGILTDMSRDETTVIQKADANLKPYSLPWLAAGVTDMVGQVLPAVAAGFVGGPAASAAAFALPVAGESFATGKESGMSDTRALENAAVYAGTETLGEMVGLGAIRKAVEASTPLVRRVGEAMLANFSEEQATQIMQQAYEAVRNGNAPVIPDYIQSLDVPEDLKQPLAFLDDQLQAGVIGMFGGGAMTAAGGIAGDAIKARIDQRQASANEANETQAKLIKSFNDVSGSLLGKRDKKSLSELMDAVAQDEGNAAPTHMLVSAEVFKQGGIDPEVFKTAVPSVALEIDQAIQLGGTVSVPVGELFTGFAGTGMEQALTEHMKVSEDAWTAFEAKQQGEQEALDQFAVEAEKIRSQQADQDTWDAQARQVYDSVLFDLNGAGNFDKKANQAYATLVRDFYSVLAPKVGKTPDQLFKEAPLSVFGRMQGNGAVLNQSGYSDEEVDFLNSMGIDLGAERSNVKERSVDEVRGYDEFNHRIRSDEYGQLLIESALDALGADQNEATDNISDGATSDGDSASGEVHDRSATLLKRVRKAADTIIRKDLKGDFAAERVVNSSLGPFTGYRTKAEVLSFPGSDYSELRIHFYGKEQDEAGLSDLPALTVFVDTQGAFTVNGPAWGSKTFDEFQSRGWAEDAKGKDGKIIDGYTRLVTPGAKGMPNSQLTAILAETHARLREKQKESRVLVDWTRVTGATGDGETGRMGARYFQNNDGHRAAFDPSSLNIYLLETADLTSFLHETGHFFLEMYSRYADQSAEVAQDMDFLLKWFGIAGETDADRRQAWAGMDLEQQRRNHEKFAESFEQYLFEGKAPNVEIQPLFDTFRRWLTSVYKSIASFLASHNGATLTPEVRGVMDRMIATEEQIQAAEEVRASKALFTTQEQSGMTDSQWKAYQEDQKQSIEQPVNELVPRSLRDMRFLSNAKGKALKKLQRESAGLRREARIDARREVLTQPEYRAWLFLKRQTEGKPAKRVKSKELDPSVDSLYAAIAKLGGLNKIEAIAQWGIDPKDYDKKSGVFGMPVLRNDGGLTPDGMTEALSQFGYLPLDEHGKASMVDLEELLFRESRGEKVYSTWADYEYLLNGDKPPSPDANDIDHIGGRLDRAALMEMYGTNNPDVRWNAPASVAPDGTLMQPAYHGSPYKFDKFSLEHMGKGEGAQAYGWGLYFAGSKEVAEYYRNALSDTKFVSDGRQLHDNEAWAAQFLLTAEPKMNVDAAKKAASVAISQESEYGRKTTKEIHGLIDDLVKTDLKETAGQLYKVEIPEDDTYLLWDKPLSEQPEKVREGLQNMLENFNGRPSHRDVVEALINRNAVGGAIYGALDSGFGREPGDIQGKQKASESLHSLGISGIKYLDGSSRGNEDGTYNYVVFDDNAVQVLETFYQKGESKDGKGPGRSLEGMGMVSNDGLHPDVVADLFGLSSGDELVRKLLTIDDPITAIEKRTDDLMMQRHSEFTDPKAMERMAEAAIHNEARVRFVATELAMLNKAMGGVNVILKAAKMYAADIISGQKIGDIRPAKHAADAARAGREADRMLAKGKTADTVMAKRNQVLHTEAARQSYAAQAEVEKGLGYFKRLEKAINNGRLDPDYGQQIIGLLERYDLRKSVGLLDLERRDSLTAWMQKQQDQGFEPVIPDYLLQDAGKTHYKRMTVDEFRDLVDAVKNIEHLGRLKHNLVQKLRKRQLVAAAAEIGAAIEDNAKNTVKDKLEKNSLKDRAADLFNGFLYMHRKFSNLLREMDGWKDGGVLWDYFGRTMNDAGDTESKLREEATIAIDKLMQPILKDGGFGMLPRKMFIPEINDSLSREGRIMVALNWGNDGNRQRLLDGDGWSPEQVGAILKTLNRQDWEFVQGTWDFLNTYREQVGAQQKRLTGVEPKWIEPAPFELMTADGHRMQLAGGYFPAKYDTDRSTKSLTQEALNTIMDLHKSVRAKTRDSYTKGRAAQVKGRPLRKDFGVIFGHITEVSHRLAWQDWLTDSKRLMAQPAVDEALRAHYGPQMIKELQSALDDIAAGEVGPQNEFEAAINHLRTGATVAGLGYNLMTSLMQPLGLTQSMARIGSKWVAKGLAKWQRMDDALPWIYERSDMMRLRGKTMQREINEVMNQVRSPKRAKLNESFFFLIQKGQMIADIPTWLGAFEKATAEGNDDARAAALADQAVLDAQSGGMLKDLARVQRGSSFQKLFTMFMSYFNATYNLSVEAVKRTDFKDAGSVMALGVDYLLLYTLPAAIVTVMKAGLTGDDDEDLAQKLAADQITYMMGTLVGLREFSSVVSGFNGYTGPAGTRFFSEAGKLAKQIEQGEADAAFWKALNNTGGILLHYPAGQINKTVSGAAALLAGETDNPAVLLFGPPR